MSEPVVTASFNHQSEKVPCSLISTGQVYYERGESGSDQPPVGIDTIPVELGVYDGRGQNLTLDVNGFELKEQQCPAIDFMDSRDVVINYYPAITEWLKEKLGAKKVIAFDHNIRCSKVNAWMNETKESDAEQPKKLQGAAQTVQSSAQIVHNDYSLQSAQRRVAMLNQKPKLNDAWNVDNTDQPLIGDEEYEEIMKGRWALINVWRNIVDTPVEDVPLALCDAATTTLDQLVTVEVRYADRVGENWFVQHRPENKWYFFPKMIKDECILLKVWDSAGEQVAALNVETGEKQSVPEHIETVPASFSFHSAFADPTARPDCPARESIEVRTLVVF